MTTRRYLVARALRGNVVRWEELAPARQEPWLRWADRALDAIDNPGETMAKKKLVEDWRTVLLKTHSMRFAALMCSAGAFAMNHLDAVASVLAMAPPELRAFVPIPVMLLLFGVVALLRIVHQPKLGQ